MYELRRATAPTESHAEPLAFLRVRFASEQENGVVIGIGVIPFPHDVYVDGYAGANFDTTWAVETANAQIRMNAGVLLAHQHGGRGKPDFSGIDRETNHDVMLPLATGVPYAPYGAVVLSNDSQKVVIARHRRLVEADLVVVPDALGTMDVTA